MRITKTMAVLCGSLLAAAPIEPIAQAATITNNVWSTSTVEGIVCIAAQNGQMTNFTPVVLYPCNGDFDERWIFVGDNGSIQGPGGLCLDRLFAGLSPGTLVQIYQCNGGSAQGWDYIGGQIRAQGTFICLEADGVNNKQLTIQPCNFSRANQYWTIH